MKNRNGFTLLEVILTLALMGIVLMISTNFFIFGNKVQNLSMTDADIQASTRLTSEYINNVTRFATKAHTIPRSSFQNTVDGVRDPNTSYLGITKEGHLVIDKPGAGLGDPRIVQMIAKKQEGIDYEIIFNQVMYDKDGNPDNGEEAKLDTLLSFSIVGKKDGKKVTEVISNIEVLNALNIDHLGTPSDPAVALAFSMVEPGSQEWIEVSPDAYITMVLDTSGSMKWDMDGKSESITDANRRITILKENAHKMIDRLANMDFDIYVSLVPFANDANDPKGFCNVNDVTELATIKAQIAALDADGATNTGDGIRRAYHQLKSKTDALITAGKTYNDFTQHMMVLVDGQTNRETRKITGRSWFFGYYVTSETSALEGGNTNNNVVVGNNRVVSVSENNNDYINFLGTNLIQKTYTFEEEEKQIINTFVIGFSNKPTDHGSLQAIGTALNGKMFEHASGQKPYVIATNAGELDFAFEQFEAEVENSLWVITRPQLKPSDP